MPHFTLSAQKPAEQIGRSSRRHTERGVPAPDNALFINSVASRDHAELFINPESNALSLKLRDHASMHGTFVDGQKLLGMKPIELKGGERIKIGNDIENGEEVHKALSFVVTFRWMNEKRLSFIDLSSPPGSPIKPARRSARYVVPEAETSDEEPDEVEVVMENATQNPETVPVGRSARSKSSVQAILNPSEGPESSRHEGSQANTCQIHDGMPPHSAHAPDNKKSPFVNAPMTSEAPETSLYGDVQNLPAVINHADLNSEKIGASDNTDAYHASEERTEDALVRPSKETEESSDLDDADCESSFEEDYNFTPEPSDEEYESESSSDLLNSESRKSEQPKQPVPASSCELTNNTAPSRRPESPKPVLESPHPLKPTQMGPSRFSNPDITAWKATGPRPNSTAQQCYSYYSQPHAFYPVHGLAGPWASPRPPPPPPPISSNNPMISGTHGIGTEYFQRPASLPFSCLAPTENRRGYAQYPEADADAQTYCSKVASAGSDLSRMSIPNIISDGNDKSANADPMCGSKRKSDMMSSDDTAPKETPNTSRLSKTDNTQGNDLDLCLTQGFLSRERPAIFDGSPKRSPDMKKLSAPAIPKNVAIDKANEDKASKTMDQALKPASKPDAHLSQLMKQMTKTAEDGKPEPAPVTVTSSSAPAPQKTQAAQPQTTENEGPPAKKVCCTKLSTKPAKAPLPAAGRPDRVRARRQNYKSAAATFVGGVLVGSVGLMGTLLAMPESWFS
ncbi:MAG: hypothetical protein M1831_004956 [Alyxoria varia]|nr:MAG: hypothetical protein M1831_004956 [Alyxoria varia]